MTDEPEERPGTEPTEPGAPSGMQAPPPPPPATAPTTAAEMAALRSTVQEPATIPPPGGEVGEAPRSRRRLALGLGVAGVIVVGAAVLLIALTRGGSGRPASTGAGSTGTASGWSRHTSTDGTFRISIPPGWRVRSATDPALTFIAYDFGGNASTNMNVTEEQLVSALTLSDYVQAALQQLNAQPNVKQPIATSGETLSGGPAERLAYHAVYSGVEVAISQYVLVHGQTVYVITMGCRAPFEGSYKDTFAQIARTFRLL